MSIELAFKGIFDIHKTLQMSPSQLSLRWGDNVLLRKSLRAADTMSQLFLTPSWPVSTYEPQWKILYHLFSIFGSLVEKHIRLSWSTLNFILALIHSKPLWMADALTGAFELNRCTQLCSARRFPHFSYFLMSFSHWSILKPFITSSFGLL